MRESDRANSQRGATAGLRSLLTWPPSQAGGRRSRSGRRSASRGLTAMAAVGGAACLFLAACSSSSPASSAAPAVKSKATAKATPAAANAQLSITPGNGGHGVDPSAGVKVTAKSGTIKTVTVTAGNAAVNGALNATHTVWQTAWALAPSTSYTVHATAVNAAGQTITSNSSFHTLTPTATNTAQIFEGQQSYGVGIPIRLTFSSPVTNKAAVERALQVTSSKPVTGAWYWDGDQTLYFRPMNYWPANTSVSFDGHLNGVRASPGVYFTADLTQTFSIGRSLIVVANTKTHYLNVFLNGNLYGHWAMSSGQPGLDTTDGTYITLEKANPTRMVGNGYNELVNYAVRFTYSGDYLHSAPWSVAQQGYSNVSHGCLNLSPDHATTYYNMALEGDPVTIIGSPAAGKWGDGFTVWFLSWQQLLNGSALGQAVQAGPSGSTFVSPSAVTETPTSNRLAGSQPGNALAQ